jgi:hypothetical protein
MNLLYNKVIRHLQKRGVMLLQTPHFYDLSLLGLKWLTDSRDGDLPRARSLSPILYSLRYAGLITERQRIAAMKDARLRMKLTRYIELCQTTLDHTRKEALVTALDHSRKHLALMLVENRPYDPKRVLARGGYKYHLTKVGYGYAERKEGPYANIITGDVFLKAWIEARENVARIMASQKARLPKAPVLTGTFDGRVSLEEFESDEVA